MLICPITGNECYGREHCAPAKYSAENLVGGERFEPVCPITTITDSLSILTAVLVPLLDNVVGRKPMTREDYIREVVKPDQFET